MKFALDFSHHPWARDTAGRAAARTLEVAQAADDAGIDAIWVSEDPEGWDAFAVLGAMAAVTERAALGTSVTNPYARHPNLLAASVATLDRLSGGRAVLGIGRGQPEWHRDALGIDTGDPLQTLVETIELLRAWWSPPHRASSPAGGHFRVREWERVVQPRQDHVPVYLAAAGPRALALAGATCDGVIFNIQTSDDFMREAIPQVRAAAAAAGRDPNSLAFVLRTSLVVADHEAAERRAMERAKVLFALVLTLPGMGRLAKTDGVDVEAILDRVKAVVRTEETLASRGGFPALRRKVDLDAVHGLIPDDFISRLGLIGPLPNIRDRLHALAEIGVTHVSVTPPTPATSADAWRSLLGDLRL